jgi:hypothetical protein
MICHISQMPPTANAAQATMTSEAISTGATLRPIVGHFASITRLGKLLNQLAE